MSATQDISDPDMEGEGPDTAETTDPAIACPSAAGLVDGRVWTYGSDAFSESVGTVFDVTRTLTDVGGGAYEIVETLVETWDDHEDMTLTSDTVYSWHCTDGALLYDGFESAVVQSYGSSFAYGWSFEPAIVLLPADAAVGSSWQDNSVGSYWYDNPDSVDSSTQYELTSAVTGSETMADTWDSLVTESVGAYVYEGGYTSDVGFSRGWAEGVGMTHDGSLGIELLSYEDR